MQIKHMVLMIYDHFFINSKKQINVYADTETSKYLNQSFSYCFKSYSNEYPATLN